MTRLGTYSGGIRLNSSEPTFVDTLFVLHKTCVISVVVNQSSQVDDSMILSMWPSVAEGSSGPLQYGEWELR
jgi:hypothetical protein